MAIKVEKDKHESIQSLFYRFTRAVQKSGILIEARKKRFRDRNKSDDLKKEAALLRLKKKKEYEKLKKLGKSF
jgi:ribosomal protein S21